MKQNLSFLLLITIFATNGSEAASTEVVFEEPVSAVYLVDTADIDRDGMDDLVISGQVDAYAQIGVECCEVPAAKVEQIKGIVPKIWLSNFGKPKFVDFPAVASTRRTWAGTFFSLDANLYFLLGKNGELGLPSQNTGEKSQIFKISVSGGSLVFELESGLTTNR